MPKQVSAPQLIRLPEVLQMTGMDKTFIYDRMKEGTFPKQIQLGGKSVVWTSKKSPSGWKTGWRTMTPSPLDISRQGTHRCSAFFCTLRNLTD